jgi:hypothetical protein
MSASVGDQVRAGPLVRPLIRRSRLWLALAGLVLLAAVLLSLSHQAPGVPLDPASPRKDGSKAVARLLAERGTSVQRITALADARTGTVLVADPNAYRADQLLDLSRRGTRLVLVAPSAELISQLDPRLRVSDTSLAADTVEPGCSDPGAQAAGAVSFADGTLSYYGLPTCYAGRVVLADEIVVFGSATVLRNDWLADTGVAALALNSISADGSVTDVQWLMPGQDAGGGPAPSIWNVFPDHSRTVLVWLIGVGLLTALWRGRRLGPPVTEPLPVVVRSAEIVEGHGRLYQRAGARDRAAAALRAATAQRLRRRFGLPRASSVAEVARALGRSEAAALLSGPAPVDDAGLIRLATGLDRLEDSTASTSTATVRERKGLQ